MRKTIARILTGRSETVPVHVQGWTVFSVSLFAASSFVLLVVTTNVLGGYWGGVVAIALAASQQLFTLGSFSMRRYQASDTAGRFAFPDYAGSRVVSCTLMAAAGTIWAFAGDFSRDKAFALLLLLVVKGAEAFSDVLEGQYQLRGRLDVSGRILATKTLVSTLLFIAVLIATRSLLAALAAMALAHLALILLLDGSILKSFGGLHPRFRADRLASLFVASLPMAVSAFLQMYLNNGPKFAVDRVLEEEAMASYTVLSMFAFVMAIFSDFILNPRIVPLSIAYREGRRRAFLLSLARYVAAIAAFGLAAVGAGWLVGTPLVSLVFGLDLVPLRMEFCLLLAGGVCLSLYQACQLVLVILRRQGWLLVSIALATVTVVLGAEPLVRAYAIRGASCAFLAGMAVLFLSSLVLSVLFLALGLRRKTGQGGDVVARP